MTQGGPVDLGARRRRSEVAGALLVLTLGVCCFYCHPVFAQAADDPIVYPAHRGLRGSLAILGGRTLAEENPDVLFTPASVQKLWVATAALHLLGPEHRIVTRIVGPEPRGGVLPGDLVVEAEGDPTWSRRFFADAPETPALALAQQLRDEGIRRIAGDLVVDVHAFPGRSFPPSRSMGDLAFGFAAPLSALAVDDNAFWVRIAAGSRVGAPGRLERIASAGIDIELVNRMVTVGAERDGDGTVDFLPLWPSDPSDPGGFLVRGEYPLSEPPYRLELAMPNGDAYAAEVLKTLFEAQGIEIEGGVRVETERVYEYESPRLLARWESPPLAERLVPILTDSRNWHAEMLLRVLARKETGRGRSVDGLGVLREFLEESVGMPPDALVLDDASGISPYNLLTPRAVVKLLDWARRQVWFSQFSAALASRGRGTLEAWPALPTLRAKTGTLRGSLTLAGYLDRPGATEPIVFAIFLDHRPGERPPQRAEIARWLQSLPAVE